MSGTVEKTITGEIGDINFDGKIDMEDYKLAAYYTAEGGASAEALHWEASPRQILAMDVDKDGKVTTQDARYIYDFIKGTLPAPSLGLYQYDYKVPSDYKDLDNVSNLLIIDGWYEKEVGIPFLDFQKDPWIIHGKFFNYLLGMAIHKYSNSESISFVQEMLKAYYPFTNFGTDFLQVGIYNDVMKDMLKEYQREKISYIYGDLDIDGKLTTNDLKILREYLYGLDDLELNTPITLKELRDYLDDPTTYPLSYEKQKWADVNRDGIIDEKDYQLLLLYKGDKTLCTKVRDYLDSKGTLTPDELELADLDNDGEVTEDDYNDLLTKYPRQLTGKQRTHADINHNGIIDMSCYYVLEANINGTSDSLVTYLIPFSLGWYDMDTEYYMEQQFNSYETISEVSK